MQRLPIPIGSPHSVRRQGRVARVRIPIHLSWGYLLIVGMILAILGAATGVSWPPYSVGWTTNSYQIGPYVLASLGGGIYESKDAAIVIKKDSLGRVEAGASSNLNNQAMVGSCLVASDAQSEVCHFTLGNRQFSATDQHSFWGWQRHYSDGRTVQIRTSGTRGVPVPFALGE